MAWRKLEQRMQQEHRIGAAGDSDADPIARFKHVITGDSFVNSFEHHSDSIRVVTDLSILRRQRRLYSKLFEEN